MTSIVFKLEFIDRVQNNVKGIFDFTNPFTNCRMSRIIYFTLTDKKGDMYKDHLKPYIEFLISHKMLTESMLTLAQDKMLSYILFKYPKSYPHTKKGMPPGISRYFRRQNYDRFCLNKDSEKALSKNLNKTSSKYPSRLLAPMDTGSTTLILGSSFSGKTYLLTQELELIKPYEYDLIILFTESIHVPCLDKIRNRPDIILKEGFQAEIPAFLKKLNSKVGLRYRFLLILDDIISEKSTRKSTLGKMITTYRNSNISTVVLAQYPTIIQKESRSNFHQLVLTGMRSPESNKAFADRFDVMSWIKERMKLEGNDKKISNDEAYCYMKKLLMDDGVVMYINLKKSLDPSVINLNN